LDAYGNLVSAPVSSVTIAPVQSSYNINLATNGLTKFVGTDTVAVDTLRPSSGIIPATVYSGTKSGIDVLTITYRAITASTNVWVTPAAYTILSLTPAKDTTAIAGQNTTLTIEKQDTYGNHIDWGLAGANARVKTDSPYVFTAPLASQIHTDSGATVVDTVTTGKNRGGHFATPRIFTIAGKAGVASVGGTLDMTVPFTAYAGGADTQKVYASFGGFKDTSIVYSIATGGLRSFLTVMDTTGVKGGTVTRNAGDSITVVLLLLIQRGIECILMLQAVSHLG